MRDFDAATEAEIVATLIRPRTFVYLDLDSGPLRWWDGNGNKTDDGDVFAGGGQFLGIGTITETTSLVAGGATIAVSGNLASMVSVALTEDYQGRPVTIWDALVDENEDIIGEKFIIYGGEIETMEWADNVQGPTIAIQCESDLRTLMKSNERRWTDEEQQRLFAGDTFFRYVTTLIDKEISWGRKDRQEVSAENPSTDDPTDEEPALDESWDFLP